MLDFEREDELLKDWVGADARQILSSASASWADRFYLARERMGELAADTQALEPVVLERDRLASYFGCAYGRSGLLARAGGLLTLRDRLQRIALLAPRLTEDAQALSRLRREAVIVRTFARERFGRGRPSHDDAQLLEAVDAAHRSTLTCADFVSAASAVGADRKGFLRPGSLWAAADLGFLACTEAPARPLIAVAAFALARLGDALEARGASVPALESLIEANLSALREEFWSANEAIYAEQSEPAPLAAIEQADFALETLLCHLSDRRSASAVRARLLAELWALVAAGRAGVAARQAARGLDGTLMLLAEGLAAETRSKNQ